MSVTINASTSAGLIQTADTSGTVEIQSNGTTRFTVASTGAYGQLVSGSAVTLTTQTSVPFTDIPSWVKRITVLFSGLSTNGTSIPRIQLGTGATPTYTTSGYLGTATSITAAGTGTTNYSSGALLVSSIGATAVLHGAVRITLITGNTWVFDGVSGLSDSAAGRTTGGSIALAAALTAIRLTTVNGTDQFDAGTINILYEG